MTLNQDQLNALNELRSGANVFLTGGAGTGKTFLLHYFLDLPENKKKNVIVCAPTGVAAINAGGATLHRTFKVPVAALKPLENLGTISDEIKSAQIIIIDEISMCRIDVFQFVMRKIIEAESKSGVHKQIILIGDFYQLPPVVTNRKKPGERYSDKDVLTENYGKSAESGFAFLSPTWKLLGFKTLALNEIVRQKDHSFSAALNQIRGGDVTGLDYINQHFGQEKDLKAIVLTATNKEADRINNEQLNKIGEKSKEYDAIINGEPIKPSDMPVSNILRLKVGARIMSLVNDNSHDMAYYSNGSLGTVISLPRSTELDDGDTISVAFDNGHTVDIEPYSWKVQKYVCYTKDDGKKKSKKVFGLETIAEIRQYPLKIAYAVTIHKSQGQTYDNLTVMPDRCFVAGQLYVALSRAVSVDKLHLTSNLRSSELITSDIVKDFYNGQLSLTTSDFKKMGFLTIQRKLAKLPYYNGQVVGSQPKKPAKQDLLPTPKEDKPSIKVTKTAKSPPSPQKESLYGTLSIIAGKEVNSNNVNGICDTLSPARRNVFLKILNSQFGA